MKYIECGGKEGEARASFLIEADVNLPKRIANLVVFNLKDETINDIATSEFLLIEAGYRENYGEIFKGAVSSFRSEVFGGKQTTFFLVDGVELDLVAFISCNVNSTLEQVLNEIEEVFNVSIQNKADLPLSKVYKNGLSLRGRCTKVLQHVLNPLGFSFSKVGGRIAVFSKSKKQKQDIESFQIGAEFGNLISTNYKNRERAFREKYATERKESAKSVAHNDIKTIEISCLLEHTLTLLTPIEFEGKKYKMKSLKFSGDTHMPEAGWKNEIELYDV